MFLKRSKQHPLADWAWWQVLLASSFAFGLVGALPGLIPPISHQLLRLGLFGALVAVAAGMANWWSYNWWARTILGAVFSFQFLAIAGRSWWVLVGVEWYWIFPALAAYALAWILPSLWPRVSATLWREQIAPETRIGRLVLALALGLGPSAGVVGAAIGMLGSRAGELDSVLMATGVLGTAVSIGFAFAASYQLWPERPWKADRALDSTRE